MKIKELIEHFERVSSWVDYNKTRDVVLFGDLNQEIKKIGVCWVATNAVIEEALRLGINFIISHENLFYENGTTVRRLIAENVNYKKELLNKGNICVYRCHDCWDKMPEYGVADTWAKDIGLDFNREPYSFNSYTELNEKISVLELAQKVASALEGQDSVQVLGDLNKKVSRIAIGTGAATDIFAMAQRNSEVFVVSDDGINSWIEMQWCLDRKIPLIICNHAACEIRGLKAMKTYLEKTFESLEVISLKEGYDFATIMAK